MSQAADELDYFTDYAILKDPYQYFEDMRSYGPVHQIKGRDVVLVTGFREATEVLLDSKNFSSIVSMVPDAGIPFEPHGDDISEQIEAHRDEFERADLLVAYDGIKHKTVRSLLTVLFTPSRLKANAEHMKAVASKMVQNVVAKGECELISEIATPYVTLVIADLLGVPPEDRERFREVIAAAPPPVGSMDTKKTEAVNPQEFMGSHFYKYITDRRANPREDVLTELCTAKLPDGSTPEVMEVVKSAMFLFAAGQDTSAKLIGNSIRYLAENPDLQRKLREDRSMIPFFLEEMLRMEGSIKATFRLAKRTTHIGDTEIKAGQVVIVSLAAANRDPLRWENPTEFKLKRDKIMQHLAFGRGVHTCVGGPLARAEVSVILNHFFDQTSDITLSEKHHGPVENRNLNYEATYVFRGLENLYIDLKPN